MTPACQGIAIRQRKSIDRYQSIFVSSFTMRIDVPFIRAFPDLQYFDRSYLQPRPMSKAERTSSLLGTRQIDPVEVRRIRSRQSALACCWAKSTTNGIDTTPYQGRQTHSSSQISGSAMADKSQGVHDKPVQCLRFSQPQPPTL